MKSNTSFEKTLNKFPTVEPFNIDVNLQYNVNPWANKH